MTINRNSILGGRFDPAASRARLPAPVADAAEAFDEDAEPREVVKYTVVERPAEVVLAFWALEKDYKSSF